MTDLDQHLPKVRRGKQARMNPVAFAIMIKMLQEKPQTVFSIMEATGLVETTVRYYCKALVLQQAAHIAAWSKDALGRDTTPHYKLGFGINMPRERKDKNHARAARNREKARHHVSKLNREIHNE